MKNIQHIAILGGGPSGLFMFKRLVDSGRTNIVIDIFEKNFKLGAGMPYSEDGANDEHITNVSGNEIPDLVTSISEWIHTVPAPTLERFKIDPNKFNDYKVLPRLLFGQYLSSQFDLLKQQAISASVSVKVHYNSRVTDIVNCPDLAKVKIEVNDSQLFLFDHAIICTGHNWPVSHEGTVPGYFDSPYPPAKLAVKLDHAVAIRGSSLTAIDAIRTMARFNGSFAKKNDGELSYQPAEDIADFKMIMHSRNGLLPAIRFHLEDSHLLKDSVLTQEEIDANRAENEGFLLLDYLFEKNFKEKLKDKEPGFFSLIEDMKIEEFVPYVMNLRERLEPFNLFKAEYTEADKSIKRKESVYWKEMLAVLSFAMNYPAKYLSAEDMLRLQKVLMPLISVVIAFVPQGSVEEMLALHRAGVLDIVSVGDDSTVESEEKGGVTYRYTDENGEQKSNYFKTFVDCIGQPHLSYDKFPYKSLIKDKTVSPATLRFRDKVAGKSFFKENSDRVDIDVNGNYLLRVPGITINDNFQVVDEHGVANHRIYIMAVPYIGGYNPDYSGLDFSEAASAMIITILIDVK